MPTQGIVFDIKELTLHDGPGVRATIFLKGCPLRCRWCHNPEGIAVQPQLLITRKGCTDCGGCHLPCTHPECQGLERCIRACPRGLLRVAGAGTSAPELGARMHRLAPLLVGGGVTISGGEPLMQPEFLLELLEELKPLHTIVETSGYGPPDVFQQMAQSCSMVYLDIKHSDSVAHKRLTGVGNEPILTNLRWLMGQEQPFLVRIPLIPGCNDDRGNLQRTAELLEGCSSLMGVELLPLNPFSAVKYQLLDQAFPLEQLAVENSLPSALQPESFFVEKGMDCRVL